MEIQIKTRKAIMVAGNWTEYPEDAKPSGAMQKLAAALMKSEMKFSRFDVHNGGTYHELLKIYNTLGEYDIVFWFANVANELPKPEPIKDKYPTVMLITSKNNLSDKYSFQELIQRALVSKSNLMIEIGKHPSNEPKTRKFSFRLFDPLMNLYYKGTDIESMADALIKRLAYIISITRQKTYQASTMDKSLVLKWYFDQFATDMEQGEGDIAVPPQDEFLNLVHEYAEVFTKLMPPLCDQKRFIGNCSLKPNPVIGRCGKSMPSFRHDDLVFVSKRNIDKSQIELEHFVPVYLEKPVGKDIKPRLRYYGQDKPSVDTPIQVRLYEALPKIKFMIHSHCYIKSTNSTDPAPFTNNVNPCGAIEEVDDILNTIDAVYGSRNLSHYYVNLKGHGSIIMGERVDLLRYITFESRPVPEYVG